MSRPAVSIVLLNWNNYDDTEECLDSLAEVTYPNVEVILLDNDSPDGSGERLRDELAELDLPGRYIQNGGNVGFARGCNPGIRDALDRGADYVLLLNNDSVVDEGFLEPLIERAERNPDVGVLTGKTYFYDEPERVHCAGADLDWVRGRGDRYGRHQIDEGQFDEPKEIGFAPGYFCFVRAAVFDDVGLLSEQYFLGAEEWDFSARVQRSDWELWYEPESVVWHKIGGSHEADPKLKYVYNGYRNKLIYMRKFLPDWKYYPWFVVFWTYAHTVGIWKFTRAFADTNAGPGDALRTIRAAFVANRDSDVVTPEEVIGFSPD